MKPTTVIICLLMFTLSLCVPRKWQLLPFIMTATIVPADQRIFLGSLDFTVLRIIIFGTVLRMLLRNEVRHVRWNNFDRHFFFWAATGTIVYILQWGFSGVEYKSGVLYDALGLYWIFRQTLRSWSDIDLAVRIFAWMAIVSVPLLLLERFGQNNLYSALGHVAGKFHRGRFRCAGPFPHAIMMGLFWAVLLPLFYSQTKTGTRKLFYWIAMLSALICCILSGSSTPLMTILAIIGFWNVYRTRRTGRRIFLFVCSTLVLLHIIMNAPVWHLISRVNVFGGSTGWHRFYLIDQFIKHTSEWFLLGTKSTAHWGWGLYDVTNQYVLEAVRGGAITLVVFCTLAYKTVRSFGRASLTLAPAPVHFLAWGLCVSMLGHLVSFIGVSYFGQIMLLLYLTLAVGGFLKEQEARQAR